MKIDAKRLAERLAFDPRISDYDFWRAAKTVDEAIYRNERQRRPIPIDLVYARAIIRTALRKREFD